MLYPLSYRRPCSARWSPYHMACGGVQVRRTLRGPRHIAYEAIGEEDFLARSIRPLALTIELDGFFVGDPVLVVVQRGRHADDRHGRLDFAGAERQPFHLGRQAHHATGQRAVRVDEAGSVFTERGTGNVREGRDQRVDVVRRPLVEVRRRRELGKALLDVRDLCRRARFDPLALM